jgi:carbon monoxide dehydrogenase subunit G
MNFDYVIKLDLPLDQAWKTLMDIERIAPCMPGATIESRDGDDYTGRLKVKLGPMEMTYRGNIHFVERDDNTNTALVDAAAKEIKGRGAAKTQVNLRGVAVDQGSEITLSSEFTVSGKAAQFGRGVMEEVGEKLMGDFATRLAAQVTADAAAAVPDAGISANTQSSAAHASNPPAVAPAVPADPSVDNDALDIGGVAMWPVLKRLMIPAVVVAIIAVVYFSL